MVKSAWFPCGVRSGFPYLLSHLPLWLSPSAPLTVCGAPPLLHYVRHRCPSPLWSAAPKAPLVPALFPAPGGPRSPAGGACALPGLEFGASPSRPSSAHRRCLCRLPTSQGRVPAQARRKQSADRTTRPTRRETPEGWLLPAAPSRQR